MAQTISTTITNARLMLNEPTATRWTDVELQRYINDGQRDIARRIPWYRVKSTATATASTQEHNAPSDAQWVYEVSWTETGTSRVIPLEQYDFTNVAFSMGTQLTTAVGVPRYFYTWGYPGTSTFKINLIPTPSVAGTLTYHYYGSPADHALTTTAQTGSVIVPLGYEDAITLFVVYSALMADADPRWQEYKQLYEQAIAALEEAAIRYSPRTGQLMGPMAPGPAGVGAGYYDDGEW